MLLARLSVAALVLTAIPGCKSVGRCPYGAETPSIATSDWRAIWETVDTALKPYKGTIQGDDENLIMLALGGDTWSHQAWRINIELKKPEKKLYAIDFARRGETAKADEIMDVVEAALKARFGEEIKFEGMRPRVTAVFLGLRLQSINSSMANSERF